MKKKLLALIASAAIVLVPATALAQSNVELFHEVCKQKPNSSVCKDADLDGQNPLYGPNGVITSIANILSILIGIAAVIGIIVAAIKMITNGNNPQEVSQARDLVIYAIIGLILAAAAQGLVRLVLQRIFFD